MTLSKCSSRCCSFFETYSLEKAAYLICKGFNLIQVISLGYGQYTIRFKGCFCIEVASNYFDLGNLDVDEHHFKKVLSTLRFLFSVGYQDEIVKRASKEQELNDGECHDKR